MTRKRRPGSKPGPGTDKYGLTTDTASYSVVIHDGPWPVSEHHFDEHRLALTRAPAALEKPLDPERVLQAVQARIRERTT